MKIMRYNSDRTKEPINAEDVEFGGYTAREWMDMFREVQDRQKSAEAKTDKSIKALTEATRELAGKLDKVIEFLVKGEK